MSQMLRMSLLGLVLGQAVTPFKLPPTLTSSVMTSDQACRNWLFIIGKLNSEHCSKPIYEPPSLNTVISILDTPHVTFSGLTKLSDATYKCRVQWPWNGCSNQFFSWFNQLTFTLLCPRVDGIDTIVQVDRECLQGGLTPCRPHYPETFMWCVRKWNHLQLVAERQAVVNEVRGLLTSRLGNDVMSCIDQYL